MASRGIVAVMDEEVFRRRHGLFLDADWYPRLGRADRSLPNFLTALHRLVELRVISLRRVRDWAVKMNVEPYVNFDKDLPER